MRYKRVKKIDHDFSVIGYGCWGASGKGSWTEHESDDEQVAAMHAAIDAGVTFFDVAPVYGLGHAETVLGKAIAGKRDKIFLATKAGLPWNERNICRNDISKKSILTEIDQSLQRLNVDYVDLYQVHWPSTNGIPIEETMEAMRIVKDSGKARFIGLTNFSVADAKKGAEIVDIASMQGLFNMIERNASSYHNIPLRYRVEKEVIPFVLEEGLAFFPYSPLFQGLLAGAITRETEFGKNDVRNPNPKINGEQRLEYLKLIDEILTISREIGKPINEIAFNWLIAQPAVTSVIASVKDAAQMNSNLKALEWDMTDDVLAELNKIISKVEE